MAANPFLFTEDDYASPHSTTSNPFLLDDGFQDEANGSDNPFLFQTTEIAQNSTNPFAFDPAELETNEPQAQFVPYSFQPTATTETVVNSDHNFFSVTTEDAFGDVESNIPQKPTDLDLKYTNTIAGDDEGNESDSKSQPPPRPPPSKETQDLLMSVMGAMDATSSHLLDRIPPTRTPSPVSVRDVHSPSPTPEPSFGDLLDVSDARPAIEVKERKDDTSDDLFMSLAQDDSCDINQNVSSSDLIKPQLEQIKPARPAPPSRPPRPLPPQKPPPPPVNQTNTFVPVQPPPKPPAPAALLSQTVDAEFVDLLGNEGTSFQKPKASTADILNLYQAPKSEIQVTDLLFDTVETVTENPPLEVTKTENVEALTQPKTPTPTEIMPETVQEASVTPENIDVIGSAPTIVQDSFISPEQTSDLHMDTSDTQSKGSASSVTFNPFSANEEVQQVIVLPQTDMFQNNNKDNAINSHNTLLDNNAFSPTPAKDIIPINVSNTTGDAFDAFAQKFESAAKEEVKNGAFDAFFNGNNDAWGSSFGAANASGGFEADESFDSFLAMQEPPAVPQSTPNRLTRAGSEDSDEDKDFSVFIK